MCQGEELCIKVLPGCFLMLQGSMSDGPCVSLNITYSLPRVLFGFWDSDVTGMQVSSNLTPLSYWKLQLSDLRTTKTYIFILTKANWFEFIISISPGTSQYHMKLSFDITLGLNIKGTCAKHITGVLTLASQATVVERRAKRQGAEPHPISTGQFCFPLVHSVCVKECLIMCICC